MQIKITLTYVNGVHHVITSKMNAQRFTTLLEEKTAMGVKTLFFGDDQKAEVIFLDKLCHVSVQEYL